MNEQQQQEPRLPQIDPITFAALNTLDTFIARAPLTRAEHVEANKSLQHLVQTLEMLQGAARQTNGARTAGAFSARGGQSANGAPATQREQATDDGKISAEIAEEIFRKASG